ncbi:BrnA antitoxin family protein [Brevundimonas sp.]|uniref:BrnA antitoxin family protein n=1 Tax=Brevundimonas sp. TaxID=1871086 RepID=UPI00257DA5D6|nr:BrnA antitoxin family protein [Brevundimonas sp.]
MSRDPKLDDPDNPEWTEADFARAGGPGTLSAAERAAFPRTRGPQAAPKKKPVSIRLDPDVLEYYRAGGPGWQSRMNADLRKAIARG